MEYELFLRDPNLNITGMITNYQKILLSLKFNGAGKWSITGFGQMPFPMDDKRWGIFVRRGGQYIFSGVMNKIQKKTVFNNGAVVKTWTVEGIDDLGRLGRRVAVPDPVGMTYNTMAYDARTGPAEDVILAYANYNAGPLALAYRRFTGLAIATSLGRGASVTGRARFPNLLTFIGGLASLGSLGIAVNYDPAAKTITFGCYSPVDRSNTVKFGVDIGNLKSDEYSRTAPKMNYVWVLGQGDMTARAIQPAVDPASIAEWELIEGTKDQRNESVAANLYQWGLQALSDNADKTGFSITPLEAGTIGYKLGLDYNLGDTVAVSDDGSVLYDKVNQVQIEYSKSGETITPQIGNPDTSMTPLATTLTAVGDLESRIVSMEVNK